LKEPPALALQPGNPPAANQLSSTEKNKTSRIPSQKLRSRQPELGEGHDGYVSPLVLVPGGINPEGDGDHHREEHGQQRERPVTASRLTTSSNTGIL